MLPCRFGLLEIKVFSCPSAFPILLFLSSLLALQNPLFYSILNQAAMGPLTRVIQTGIGLAAELKAASKERKAYEAHIEGSTTGKHDVSPSSGSKECSPVRPRPDQISTQAEHFQLKDPKNEKDTDDDEPDDDEHFGGGAVMFGYETGEDEPPPYTEEELASADDVKFSEPNAQATKSAPMKCPIVIPQRRPGSKTRGFIRAYAEVLSDYDIDQDTFLTFLKSFHKASQVCHISFDTLIIRKDNVMGL